MIKIIFTIAFSLVLSACYSQTQSNGDASQAQNQAHDHSVGADNEPVHLLADREPIDPVEIEKNRCGEKKVLVCHVPPGNPANAHTICIGEPAVEAHLANHGDDQIKDYLGECKPCAPSETPPPVED